MAQAPGNSAWHAVSVSNAGSSTVTPSPSRAGSVNIPDELSPKIDRGPLWVHLLFWVPVIVLTIGFGYFMIDWIFGGISDVRIPWPPWRP